MARINIEDSIKSDIRFMNMAMKLGSFKLALGEVVWAWMLAQKHFLNETNGRSIPLTEWQEQECSDLIIDVGLAKVTKHGILVSGAEKQFGWLLQKKNAGETSGRVRKSRKQTKEDNKNKNERPLPSVEHTLTDVNGSEPLSSFLSSPSSLLNSQSSFQIAKKPNSANSPKANAFVAAYCERFKSRWKHNPEILPKDSGIAKRISKTLPLEKFEQYLDSYFAMPDAWLAKVKHPLSAFETKLNEIVVFHNTGNFTTNRQVNQADDYASNMILLDQVRKGNA